MRRAITLLSLVGLVAFGAFSPAATASRQDRVTRTHSAFVRQLLEQHGPSFCQRFSGMCSDVYDNVFPGGGYTGHDEPSVLFYSNQPGSGSDITYQIRLPKNPVKQPTQDAKGPTWDFQLRPTFWLGLALCDSESSPEYTKTCAPASDANDLEGIQPKKPNYIGFHPGTAYMELQFYGPGYVPQFAGFGCTATQYCASLTIDSLSLDENNGTLNNDDCLYNHFLVGLEPVNWAYITKNGVPQAPANPLYLSDDPTLAGLNPDPTKDLMMNPGDRLTVHMFDTPDGLRVDIADKTTGKSGFMVASEANGFGQILFEPGSATCHVAPYAFHPQYDTAVARGDVWGAHTYNVAYSDEIGHFEYCNAIDGEFGNCTSPGAQEPDATLDDDDSYCFTGASSTLVDLTGCFNTDDDFDGPAYHRSWAGTNPDPVVDQRRHPTSVWFSSPTFSGGQQYGNMGFEADMPRIEETCDRFVTGAGCVNPPPGAAFYPLYSSRILNNGSCRWQEGGPYIPGTDNLYGGDSVTEFGTTLLNVYFPNTGFHTIRIYEDFQNILGYNPCLQ